MALEKLEWQEFFTDCGIPDEDAKMYAELVAQKHIQGVEYLSKQLLLDIGITLLETYWSPTTANITDDVKPHSSPIKAANHVGSKISRCKPHNTTLPPVKSEMTRTEFRKF